MFAAESRITMTMLTAIVVFTCTWLFANADPKPCPQALDCLNQDNDCLSEATFTCLSNLRGTCDVDESKVSFIELLPYSEFMCNAFLHSASGLSACETLGQCVRNNTVKQIMEASPEERNATSGLLVSSYTYCSFLQNWADCFVNEEEAGRCNFSTEVSDYMMNAKQNLAELCESNDSTRCPQVLNCLKTDDCPSNTTFTCLSNLRETCDVDESKVTFRELVPYSEKICNAIEDHRCEVSSCETLEPCINNITLNQIMEASPVEWRAMSGLLVSSDTYCSYLQDMATCIINEKEAGRCKFCPDFINNLMVAKNLAKLCGSTGSVAGLVVNTALTLIGAAIASFAK